MNFSGLIGRLVVFSVVILTVIRPSIRVYVFNVPSIIFFFGCLSGTLLAKFGLRLFMPWKLPSDARENFVRVGINSSLLFANLGLIINVIERCEDLTKVPFGPMLGLTFVPVLYGLCMVALVFYPMAKDFDVKPQLLKTSVINLVIFVFMLVTFGLEIQTG